MTERFVTVHGHFYQPPRENPWLEAVEVQDSAYPFHDWNERVTAECYAPNAAARILDGEGRIARIVNNYSRISFDFGPTLLAWLESARPRVYQAILNADRLSAERFSGHGSALAQAHSHLILPLANRRDKETQVIWGVRDFRHRFGRDPEGMWLPETAVDVETLEVLAGQGLRFTVLAPHQAARVRPLVADGQPRGEWIELDGGRSAQIDTTRPYLCRLPSGRSIALFFYDGPTSRAVAFEDLLEDGERFARRLVAGFWGGPHPGPDSGPSARLAHIATDGETYGHHHRYGEMALAYALDRLAAEDGVALTNYGEHLARRPPTDEVEIRERTSWSCVHGVERWRGDCGCHTGGAPGWNQRWRGPLRAALDWLRDQLAPKYEQAAGELLSDPWAARDAYVDVMLERSDEALGRFFAAHAARELSAADRIRARKLLELQRHALYMYTSCGWFFNDLSGIETVQILQYAGRALQIAQDELGDALEAGFVERLAEARSNLTAEQGGGDGRRIYERKVLPARVTLARVGAHYALSSLFEEYPHEARIFSFRAEQKEVQTYRSGRARLAVGRFRIESTITGTSDELSFAVLHFGDHHLNGGVRHLRSPEAFEAMAADVSEAFEHADFARVLRHLDHHFLEVNYSLDSLFRDEQRAVLDLILESTRADAEAHHRRVYEDYGSLMQYLGDLGTPLPLALKAAAEVVLNLDLRRLFEDPRSDLDAAERLFRETRSWKLELDTAGLSLAVATALEEHAERLAAEPGDLALLQRLEHMARLARTLPFEVDLAATQNAYYGVLQSESPPRRAAAAAGDDAATAWTERFRALGGELNVRVD